MKILRYYITVILLSLSVAFLSISCQEDEICELDYLSYGEDVTLVVPVSYPEMEVQSRADRDDAQMNLVRTLWVRTYSSITNQATSDWVKLVPNTEDNRVPHELTISTKSGNSYIVGVANVDNMGTTKDNPDVEVSLRQLLDKADTWQDFQNIAVKTPYVHNDVDTVPIPITMCGCFYPLAAGDEPHPGYRDWETNNYEPVYIPASGKTTISFRDKGAIHLRRLVSHIRFNIKAGPNISITPESYTVVNVPRHTWLYERGGTYKNFGDYAESETEAISTYYATPSMFTSQYFAEGTDGAYTFDFWQGENKHEALKSANCKYYNQRESEVKKSGTNTGLYKSLTGEAWTPNNMASYVLLRCLVDYDKEQYVNDNGDIVTTDGKDMYRNGEADFVIHLGYLDGNAADFNCYRNVDYTYNVTVLSINQIQVEATSATGVENMPGMEGMVSDSDNKMVILDAHYAAFNIALTKAELTNVSEDGTGFGYVITAWDNGKSFSFNEKSTVAEDEKKYEEWVELRPTTSATALAAYKPRTGDYSDGLTFTLRDASGARNWAADDERFSSSGYYTVFVNEYVYEDDNDEGTSTTETTPQWARYVNQNSRRFYIRVTRSVSDDGQCSYVRSKYAYSQQSIATYYSDSEFTPAQGSIKKGSALGVERENETLGLNLRSSISTSTDNGVINGSTTSVNNGRYNVWLWLQNKDADLSWTTFVKNETITIPKVPATQGGPEIPQRTISIPKLANYDGNFAQAGVAIWDEWNSKYTSNGNARDDNDPQPNSYDSNYYIEAINACMNRNRDNNGNGVVDENELRWYVPASGQYVRLVLAHNTLRDDALMDYEKITESINKDNRYNTRYLFYMSNNRVLWGMEGLSTSRYGQYCNSPWQIRCVRNLGSDLSTIKDEDMIVHAYQEDEKAKIVRMKYYDANSVRSIIYTGIGNGKGTGQMPVHLINSNINRPYSAFEYSELQTGSFNLSINNVEGTSNPCRSLTGNGWRLPNQKELAILQNLGRLSGLTGSFAPSCTMSYFDNSGAPGGGVATDHLFMVSRTDGGTQVDNGTSISGYRCVRDYPQP